MRRLPHAQSADQVAATGTRLRAAAAPPQSPMRLSISSDTKRAAAGLRCEISALCWIMRGIYRIAARNENAKNFLSLLMQKSSVPELIELMKPDQAGRFWSAAMPRILVADDHGLYRRGLRIALESMLSNVEVVEADSMDAAIARLEDSGRIDLAMIDIRMEGELSLNILREIRATYPNTRFVIISASEARGDILRSLELGFHGYISKNQPDAEIIKGTSDVLSGRIYVPPAIADIKPAIEIESGASPFAENVEAQTAELHKLTARQRDVLTLIAEGRSNKEIARALSIAETTTKIHVAALMRILGVRNRTEAAMRAGSWLKEAKC
jgi:DNA-binding NarL/FixJ family response regulator